MMEWIHAFLILTTRVDVLKKTKEANSRSDAKTKRFGLSGGIPHEIAQSLTAL
jgi:hypothetical protein